MGEVVPLYVWQATGARLSALKAAKAQMVDLDVHFVIRPAGPGCGKCLAWDTVPPFACEYALLSDSTTSESMQSAIYSYIGVDTSPKWRTMAHWLTVTMGATVTEVETTKEEPRVRFE